MSAAKVAAEIKDWMEVNGRPDEIIHGACRGVDQHAAAFAEAYGIPCRAFPADWRKDGKGAGPRRNARMAQEATHALVIHTGSRGSKDMVRQAVRARIDVDEREVIADECSWASTADVARVGRWWSR
ncbi:MAG: DUF2493 domain-containing protein [Gemmatimonadaceae bacterium]|nr:DUF2493 domain-containing protein [Gemmatimonadaceae bacterium]